MEEHMGDGIAGELMSYSRKSEKYSKNFFSKKIFNDINNTKQLNST